MDKWGNIVRGSVTLFLVDRGCVLMNLRDGRTKWAPNMWSLPGGHVELGESIVAAADRELLEETDCPGPVKWTPICLISEHLVEGGIHPAVLLHSIWSPNLKPACREGRKMEWQTKQSVNAMAAPLIVEAHREAINRWL